MSSGILLINKPSGMTSHDVVYHMRRQLNIKKIGHTGTLDPFATGLLILLIGNATKLAFMFEDLDKAYSGRIVFGKSYDTDDTTGEVIEENGLTPKLEEVETSIKKFLPTYHQLPPLYSAIKKGGIKAYEAARKGITLDLDKRLVSIYYFDIIKFEGYLDFKTKVSKGTYIRSIARDLGYELNTFGALSILNRTEIGDYSLDNAKTLEDVTINDLIPDKFLFTNIRKLALNDYMVNLVKNGVYLDERQTSVLEPFIVVDNHNNYIAYYEYIDKKFKPKYFF